jgi:hypothetical protein
MILPAAGRPGPPPTWPLPGEPSEDEAKMWVELWGRPEAVAWEAADSVAIAGLYVRRFIEAAEPGSAIGRTTLARQLAEVLGLTPAGLRINRWKVGGAAEQPENPALPPAGGRVVGLSSRQRFRPQQPQG